MADKTVRNACKTKYQIIVRWNISFLLPTHASKIFVFSTAIFLLAERIPARGLKNGNFLASMVINQCYHLICLPDVSQHPLGKIEFNIEDFRFTKMLKLYRVHHFIILIGIYMPFNVFRFFLQDKKGVAPKCCLIHLLSPLLFRLLTCLPSNPHPFVCPCSSMCWLFHLCLLRTFFPFRVSHFHCIVSHFSAIIFARLQHKILYSFYTFFSQSLY